MSKKTIIGITIVVVVVVLGIGLYWLIQKQPEKYKGTVEKITLAAAGDEASLVFIAEEHGYFRDHNLDVTINRFEAGKLAADALIAGEADISTSADFVLVSNSFEHKNLRVLGSVSVVNNCEVVARKDHGISQPSDLKGKKIGVTKKSSGEFYLGTFLISQSLLLQDVEIVDLNPSEIVEAVSAGNIDAGLTWQPHVYKTKHRLGQNAISWPGQSGQDFLFILISKEEWLKEHSAAAERFLKALIQAEEFVKSNAAEAKKFVKEYFQYDSVYIETIWPNYQYVVIFPQSLIVVLEDQARWRIENNLTTATKIPNYLDYIYMDALEKAKPEAIGIIH